MHFTCSIPCLLSTTHFNIEGNPINVGSLVDFWMGGVDQRLFGLSAVAPPEQKNPKIVTPVETLRVCGSPTPRIR